MDKRILVLLLLFLPVLASTYSVQLNQFLDLNATIPYINNFMKCYLTNNSLTFWDSYINGTATILVSNHTVNYTYILKCCDNCHFVGNTLYLSDYSLHYELGQHNITGNMGLEYYVADVVESSRTISGLTNAGGDVYIGGFPFAFWMLLLFILVFGLSLFFLTGETSGLILGCSMGAFVGVLYLWFNQLLTFWQFLGVTLLSGGVVGSWSKIGVAGRQPRRE